MNAFRVFFVDGFLAYRALFRWLKPSTFIPTVLGGQGFLLLVFIEIGRFAGQHPVTYYAIGNAVYSGALPTLFATAMCVSGDRDRGTLGAVLASPARRMLVLGGRVVPAAVMGLFTAVTMLGLVYVIAGVRIPAGHWPATLLTLLVSTFSCGSFGLLLGAIALRTRDELFISNLASHGLRLFVGVNFSIALFPVGVKEFAAILPMTNGIQAARQAIEGQPFAGALWREVAVGAGYFIVAVLMVSWFEQLARRGATLDLS